MSTVSVLGQTDYASPFCGTRIPKKPMQFQGLKAEIKKTRLKNNSLKKTQVRIHNKMVLNSLNFQFICAIPQLLNSDWTANILAGLNFRAQENGPMSPDGVCAISACLAGRKTILYQLRHI